MVHGKSQLDAMGVVSPPQEGRAGVVDQDIEPLVAAKKLFRQSPNLPLVCEVGDQPVYALATGLLPQMSDRRGTSLCAPPHGNHRCSMLSERSGRHQTET